MNDEATVFLVDDDPGAVGTLAALVKTVFPRVATFCSADEFLAAYHDQPGCLVLDVAMPGMSGLELHQKLIEEKIILPVVYVTGYGNVSMAVEAMRMGAVDFIEKPVQGQELWSSIHRALEINAQSRGRRARRRHAERLLTGLSLGQHEVLNLILDGKTNKDIAAALNLSIRTVEDRRAKLMRKMGTSSLAELVQLVMTH